LKLNVIVPVDVGVFVVVVVPVANGVPEQVAPENQLKVYGGVPCVAPAVNVVDCPRSKTVFDSSNVFAICVGLTETAIAFVFAAVVEFPSETLR
jgi:hypothetical protein